MNQRLVSNKSKIKKNTLNRFLDMCLMLSQALIEAVNQRDRNRLDGGSHHIFVMATKEIMLDLYILYLYHWVTTTDTPEAKLHSFPQIQNWGQLEKKKRSAWERWIAARRQSNHTVAPQNKFRWEWVDFLRAEKYQKKNWLTSKAKEDQSDVSVPTDGNSITRQYLDSFSIFLLTFSANHRHCKKKCYKTPASWW